MSKTYSAVIQNRTSNTDVLVREGLTSHEASQEVQQWNAQLTVMEHSKGDAARAQYGRDHIAFIRQEGN